MIIKVDTVINGQRAIKEVDINIPEYTPEDEALAIEMAERSKLNTLYNEKCNYESLLHETDDDVIKFFEGIISSEEYEPIKLERERLRNLIESINNELGL